MKKKQLFLLLLAVCLMLCACTGGADDAKIMLAESACALKTGERYQISYEIDPKNTPVTFSSADPEIAAVDAEGNVEALASGTTLVTVSAGEYSKAYLEITVAPATMQAAPNLLLSSTELELIAGTQFDLTAAIKLGTQTLSGDGVTWETSDAAVVTAENGRLSALAPGEATVTASAAVDGETVTAVCRVTVLEYYRVELDSRPIEAMVGDVLRLSARVFDQNGQELAPENGELELFSTNPDSVAVENGAFKVINIGTAAIGVRYRGNAASVPVEISSLTADFFNGSTRDFYGEVDGETFCGVLFESAAYQPHLYFSENGVARLHALAEKHGYTSVRVHAYAILKNNAFVINNQTWVINEWKTHEIPISEISTSYDFWTQSEGTTEVYLWFEFH